MNINFNNKYFFTLIWAEFQTYLTKSTHNICLYSRVKFGLQMNNEGFSRNSLIFFNFSWRYMMELGQKRRYSRAFQNKNLKPVLVFVDTVGLLVKLEALQGKYRPSSLAGCKAFSSTKTPRFQMKPPQFSCCYSKKVRIAAVPVPGNYWALVPLPVPVTTRNLVLVPVPFQVKISFLVPVPVTMPV